MVTGSRRRNQKPLRTEGSVLIRRFRHKLRRTNPGIRRGRWGPQKGNIPYLRYRRSRPMCPSDTHVCRSTDMNQPSTISAERRRHPRTALRMSLRCVRLDPDGGDVEDTLHMVDISRSGMGAICQRPFYPGQRIVLCLPQSEGNGRRNIYASVVRFAPGRRGLSRRTGIRPHARNRLVRRTRPRRPGRLTERPRAFRPPSGRPLGLATLFYQPLVFPPRTVSTLTSSCRSLD